MKQLLSTTGALLVICPLLVCAGSTKAETFACSFTLATGLAATTIYRRVEDNTFSVPHHSGSYTLTAHKETERAIWFFEPTDHEFQGPAFSVTVIDKETGHYYMDLQAVREPDVYRDLGHCEMLQN